MRLLRLTALLAVLFLPTLALAPAAADDDAPLVVLACLDVASLTAGRSDHIRHAAPMVLPHAVSDEENPLFGAEGEEPLLPLGTVDELIELLKNAVQPWFWERRRGADIRASGERTLVVRATPGVHAEVGRFLQTSDRAHGVIVTVDLQAVRLTVDEAEALPRAGDPDALVYGPGAGPAVSLTTLSGNRAAIASGLVRTWIADADVEVAQNAKSPDPWVMAGTLGLSADLRPLLTPDGGHVILELHASLSRLLADRGSPTGATGRIELPVHEIVRWHSTVRLATGRWHLIDGGTADSGPGGWSCLVRVTPQEMRKVRSPTAGFELPVLPGPVVATMALRYFPVKDLGVAPEHVVGDMILPIPTAYTPPEPPELPEPSPLLPAESIVDLVRELGPDAAWEDPATIEFRSGTLIVRNTPPVLDGVARLLDGFRRAVIREIETRTELVEIPADLARHLPTGGVIDDRALAVLEEALASGQAVRLAGGRVTSMGGARNATLLGRLVPYVQGFHTEIAEGSAILNPVIARFLDGMTIDVRPAPSVDGGSVQLALRFLRSRQVGDLRVATAGAGARIELPEVEILQVGSELMLPLGRTAVAASYGQGGRRILLLLTPRDR